MNKAWRLYIFLVLWCCASLLLAACSASAPHQSSQAEKQQMPLSTQAVDLERLKQARLTASQTDGVTAVAALALGNDLSVAVEVKQWSRWRLKGIRQDIYQNLTTKFPDMDVHVTTDRKIFREIKKLQKLASEDHPDIKYLQTQLKKCNEDMKG